MINGYTDLGPRETGWVDSIPVASMNEFEARQYVEQFVGEELMHQINLRVADGQKVGQAIINAGDRHDRVWGWAPGWSDMMERTSWVGAAEWLKRWGSVENVDDIPKGAEEKRLDLLYPV